MSTNAGRLFLFLSFLTLVGCGPFHLGVKEQQINVEQYPDTKDFLKNQELAERKNFSEDELLKLLKNKGVQKLGQISAANKIQENLLGNLAPHATREDLSDISAWIMAHRLWVLPYKNMRTEFYFDLFPISYNFLSFGADLNITFITKRDENDPASAYMLERVIVTGEENSRSKEKEYIWEGLGSAFIGIGKKFFF